MPIIEGMKKPFILYYHCRLDKQLRGGQMLRSLRPEVSASMEPVHLETGYPIIEMLQRDGCHLVFTGVAMIRPPDTRLIFEPPVQNLAEHGLRLNFCVGDMPQASLFLVHLNSIGRWSFADLPINCPPRQHFYIDVEGGDERMWDGREFWIALDGYRYRELRLKPITTDCPHCRGTGTDVSKFPLAGCKKCDGTGRIEVM